jgi:2-polyprenyl-3-methyl-5-hydroxy-6-metoxy-1,4-benzoquinol methylase
MNWKWQLAQQLEWRWWNRYLSAQAPETYLQWKRNYWQQLLQRTGQHWPPGTSVLDAGCGPAGIFIALEHCHVDAVDPLLTRYDQLPHFRGEDYPWVRFYASTLEAWEPTTSYDVVCCLNAINHVQDLELGMRKLCAAAKPGATLLVSIDAHRYGWFKHLLRWLPLDALHPHQHSAAEYARMLEAEGCTVVQRIRYERGFWFDYYILIATKHDTAV